MSDLTKDLETWESLRKSSANKRKQGVSLEKASNLRAEGNTRFKKGLFEEAESLYTSSIECCETVEALTNRALARLKLGNASGCREDCDRALGLDPRNAKALARRGMALSALGEHESALRDLTGALEINPTDAALRHEKEREEAILAAQRHVVEEEDDEVLVEETPSGPQTTTTAVPKESPVALNNAKTVELVLQQEGLLHSNEFAAPTSLFSFTKLWRELKDQPGARARLLFDVMTGDCYKLCFEASIEPDLLNEMLVETLRNKRDPTQLLEQLSSLSSFKLGKLMIPRSLKQEIEMTVSSYEREHVHSMLY